MSYSDIILGTHAFLRTSELRHSPEQLRHIFSVKSKFDPDKLIPIYKESGDWFGIPLYYHKDLSKLSSNIIDRRTLGQDVSFRCTATLRERQVPVYDKFMQSIARGKTGFLLHAPTGSGKCLGKGTPVLMFSGQIKLVEDIVVGDVLMGPDSQPRTVVSTTTGREEMFRVIPTKGDSFTANRSHILSVQMTGAAGGFSKDEIVNLSINDYLAKSRTFKHCAKLWRTGVDFSEKFVPGELPAYLLGVWLGDGSTRCASITNSDPEILEYLYRYADTQGLSVRDTASKDRCPTYSLSNGHDGVSKGNPFLYALRHFNLISNKHVPDLYKFTSRERRLDLLAGLLDTDGYLTRGSVYEFLTKFDVLSDDVLFLARSLGFAAHKKRVTKTIKSLGFSGEYWRIFISGDVDEIPCKVVRKQASPRRQKKNVLRTGFFLESLGEGDYYGFELSGNDRLFLLGDFTVTHNTVMMISFMAQIGKTALIIVPRSSIIDQWKQRLLEHTDLTEDQIGLARQSTCDFDGKAVVIGMIHSLSRDKYGQEFKRYFGQVWWDEVHTAGAQVLGRTLNMFPAKYRGGASATIDRADGCADVYKLTLAQCLLEPKTQLTDVRPTVFLREYRTKKRHPYLQRMTDVKSRRGVLITSLADDLSRNVLFAVYISKFRQSGRRVLMLSDRIKQLETVRNLLTGRYGMAPGEVGLYINKTRKLEKERIARTCPVILATYGIFSMAVDIPNLRGLVLGTPMSDVEQSMGRILRICRGTKDPVILDVIDTAYPDCIRWAGNRQKNYEKQKSKLVMVK